MNCPLPSVHQPQSYSLNEDINTNIISYLANQRIIKSPPSLYSLDSLHDVEGIGHRNYPSQCDDVH
jgi:hypothetical protein